MSVGRLARLGCAIGLLGLSACSPQPDTPLDSPEKLPDLGGWWLWEPAPEDYPAFGAPPNTFLYSAPFVPSVAAQVRTFTEAMEKGFTEAATGATLFGDAYDAAGYCRPPSFRGFNGESFNTWFEVLVTPGRVTIIDENSLVRRIDLDRPLPAEVEVSDAGTSVGRWEGQTLVVETRRREAPGPRSWGAMHVVERILLEEPDMLRVDVVITAPEVFTRPFERTLRYRRDRQHEFHEETPCVAYDRYGDPATGKQRFDLTPPPDLPPPPGD